jgi:hypothetical protein
MMMSVGLQEKSLTYTNFERKNGRYESILFAMLPAQMLSGLNVLSIYHFTSWTLLMSSSKGRLKMPALNMFFSYTFFFMYLTLTGKALTIWPAFVSFINPFNAFEMTAKMKWLKLTLNFL